MIQVVDAGKLRELTHLHKAEKRILADEAEASSANAKAKGKAKAPPVDPQCPHGHAYWMHGIEAKDRTKVTLVPWTHLRQEDSNAQLHYDTKARIAVLTDLVRQQLEAYGEEDFTVVLRQPKLGASGATRRIPLSRCGRKGRSTPTRSSSHLPRRRSRIVTGPKADPSW